MIVLSAMLAAPQDFFFSLEKGDPHSVIKTWASNAYTRINRLLRTNNIGVIQTKTPSALLFIKLLLAYFDTHGVTPDQIGAKRLYRGIDAKFKARSSYVDNGFMSTSWSKTVAQQFAKTGDEKGMIQVYSCKNLPSNAKYVIIDRNIAPYLNENEVLFMPGVIHFRTELDKDAVVQCDYTMQDQIIDTIKRLPMPKVKKMRGGGNIHTFDMMEQIKESMGRHMVYYRVRYNQPVEVVGRLDIPDTWDEAVHVIRFTKVKKEQWFEDALELIPEYVELRKKSQKGEITTEDFYVQRGYEIFPALYDHTTHEVLTINAMIPDDLFLDFFDIKRKKDVVQAIKTWSACQVW